jgi:N,N'-diacetyllegionaminate synthase
LPRIGQVQEIRISSRSIGHGEPTFIIAEAGVNHNGDANLARKLIDVARGAGADAVKFQSFKAHQLVSKYAGKARYQRRSADDEESQLDMIRGFELAEKDFGDLSAYARKKSIVFLSSPFDKRSVDMLEKLGVPAFKIASGEITNLPLLKHLARKRKPLILSTGMSTLGEVEEAVGVIRKEGAEEIILLHCVSSYPAKAEDMNLRAMATLRCAFDLPVGLSDHTLGITIPIAAVALGACVLEKHFTLDKSLPGPDHRASLEPEEFKEMVRAIREVEKAMGDGSKAPTKEEKQTRQVARRSIVAAVNIPEGMVITKAMLAVKRPGTGIEPKYMDKVIGAVARQGIQADEPLTMSKLEMRR